MMKTHHGRRECASDLPASCNEVGACSAIARALVVNNGGTVGMMCGSVAGGNNGECGAELRVRKELPRLLRRSGL